MWGAIVGTVILQLLIVYLPFTEAVFKTTALDWNAMRMILIVTILCILGIELIKYLTNRKYSKTILTIRPQTIVHPENKNPE